MAEKSSFLRWYAYAFMIVTVVAVVMHKEWVAAAGLIASVNIACTYHVCREISGRGHQS